MALELSQKEGLDFLGFQVTGFNLVRQQRTEIPRLRFLTSPTISLFRLVPIICGFTVLFMIGHCCGLSGDAYSITWLRD